ncbi:hypothetical protein [Kineococcus rhizosphaerae]|uniref:Uncharacterized protein n=1 Tax=Kineococcus rhizosphaerae TaxID=559628 RepID=A0A2T0R5X4_9ACTN|nr:hypothetical protein [Kineococcus rhizosphaerae]PRY16573.1 hypothetical protein CLV37_1032 [Kineococcus rhizosphaerae]
MQGRRRTVLGERTDPAALDVAPGTALAPGPHRVEVVVDGVRSGLWTVAG